MEMDGSFNLSPGILDQAFYAAKVASKSDQVESIRSLTKYVDSRAYVIPLLERKISYYYNPLRIKSLVMQDKVQMLNLAKVELN
ncbi:hypothetical protein [Fluviispira vulneris]|uniref:hypothetical protein n=1 Tax=Fluviispira vulneris TaxID=2763012 RepID=UPI001644AF13|nr:hypothetical protein [Fluviispira vulneris]